MQEEHQWSSSEGEGDSEEEAWPLPKWYEGNDWGSVAPYAPTPSTAIRSLLTLADVSSEDVVFDLGCGDGRILIACAQERGARGVGFDIDGELCAKARARVDKRKLQDLVAIEEKSFLGMDLLDATLVTIFLLPECMPMIKDQLTSFLLDASGQRRRRRIVAVIFPLENGFVPVECDRQHSLYLYTAESVPPQAQDKTGGEETQ